MKNKLLVAFMLMVAASFAQVCAQVDTLRGRVPYFHYNYYDSNWCKSQPLACRIRTHLVLIHTRLVLTVKINNSNRI